MVLVSTGSVPRSHAGRRPAARQSHSVILFFVFFFFFVFFVLTVSTCGGTANGAGPQIVVFLVLHGFGHREQKPICP
jgi:hypothetical protein